MDAALFVPLGLLFAFILLRVPIAYALAISGFIGVVWNLGLEPALSVLGTQSYTHSANLLLTTVPMFILMAEFLGRSSLLGDLMAIISKVLGRVRGGLAMSTVLANAGFAALSGSSTAAAGAMSRLIVPQMRRFGYDDRLSLGVVAASGTLAAMIPPSIALIIYGVQTETSIGDLFIAGVIPGLLTVIAYIATISLWLWRRPSLIDATAARGPVERELEPALAGGATTAVPAGTDIAIDAEEGQPPSTEADGQKPDLTPSLPLGRSLVVMACMGALAAFLLVAIYTGIITATEAGAVGAFVAMVFAILFGGLKPRGIVSSARDAAVTTASILIIVIGAIVFGVFLTATRVTTSFVEAITSQGWSPLVVVGVIVVVYLVLGAFMDQIAIMLLTLPFTFPVVTELGFDAVWFGIVVVKTVEIGLMTPPLGLNVYVAAGAVKGRLGDAFAGAMRFVLADLVVLVLIIAIPGIATWLPSLGA